MGRILTEKNKVKFEIADREDCIMYLGHVIEYFEKKKDVYVNLLLQSVNYLGYEMEENGAIVDKRKNILQVISENKNIDFNIDFYKFKLFNSAINFIKNEMLNVIGDFSADKLAISYNNYLDIISDNNIEGVTFKYNKHKKKLVEKFNTSRNFMYHFSSDKLCEWIDYREDQVKKYKNAKFEFGKEFNIYISDTIPYKVFVHELVVNYDFYEDANKISDFMKKDFESLIGEEVKINIKKHVFDNSAEDITYNGFESHELSKNRRNKRK
ncbi:hypothetical protein [Clostridium sp. M14]|uniref:hypothetical protein n=1 Tax=Clostridium sp. M14 TaxID=2716311 RepID=UPI0013EEB00C|nr:hypothetical protein [Clostridium sp. M14]MBZ9692370.1 hypothetical protein [Clostridium sp. M14]